MKKIFLSFLLLVFHSSLGLSQDTIVLNNGKKIIGKILSVGEYVDYTDSKGKKKNEYGKTVMYIHYSTGEIYGTIGHLESHREYQDTIKRKFFLAADYGWSFPIGKYGANEQPPSLPFSTIDGNANTGFHYDVTTGYNFMHFIGGIIMYGVDNIGEGAVYPAQLNSPTTNFNIRQYFVGLILFSNAESHKLSFRFEWLTGIINSNYPSYSFGVAKYADNFPYYDVETNTILSNGKGWGNYISPSIEYSLTKFIRIHLGFALMFANIKYSNSSTFVQYYWGNQYPYPPYLIGISTQTYNNPVSMGLSTFQINFGLSVHFIKGK